MRNVLSWFRKDKKIKIWIPFITNIIYESAPGHCRLAIGYGEDFKIHAKR